MIVKGLLKDLLDSSERCIILEKNEKKKKGINSFKTGLGTPEIKGTINNYEKRCDVEVSHTRELILRLSNDCVLQSQ